MKQILFFLGVLLVTQSVNGQLFISPGAQLCMAGNAAMTLQNTDMINNGSFIPGTGSVYFTGDNNTLISGTQPLAFSKIELSKTTGSAITMQRTIKVDSFIRFIAGNINLNNHNIDLGNSGMLIGEKENSRITGITGGQVLFSTTLNNPVAANPANLGAVITSAKNMGNILIRRGHKSQVNNYGMGNTIQRYYDIIPANNTSLNATLRINYFDGELNALTENSLVSWSSVDNLHWTNQGYTFRNTANNYVEKTGIPSFSRWTLSGINNPLPVKFISFNLKCEEDKVLLNWKTAQEQNSSHYDIEKKTANSNWVVLKRIQAAGNSSSEKSYTFIDNTPVQNSFYRVAQYDMDGQVDYTGIIRSTCEVSDVFTVWPNPFINKININLTTGNKSDFLIKIFDAKGALVKKTKADFAQGNNQLTINLEDLPNGMYNISAEDVDNRIKKVVQVIKY